MWVSVRRPEFSKRILRQLHRLQFSGELNPLKRVNLAFIVCRTSKHRAVGEGLQVLEVGSDLIQNIISQILPTIKKYFNPLSDTAADIVDALLKDLNNKTGTYLLKSSSAFQNLRDIIRTLQPRLKDIGQDLASCVVKEKGEILDIINAAEKETEVCARGLVAEIKPLAINISHTVTEIQAVAIQLNPIITDCVTSNAVNPVALSRCLSKLIAPAFNGLSKIAVKAKNDFRRYEQENSNLQAQLQQCSTQFRETVASVQTLVQEVRQCINKWEQSDSS
ncbi:hypothetical protein B7P43_G09848 [Cryptotermes secundus]|uniref:Protein TsetseEP domain-containing protein n=1 Tax=Cryptotermes secundus TaxID=105785 RepID=A0A2J7PC51_9NEOP|nr:hypothetical protein B7P43_G09848 [Cryptotermes secundus]